METVHLDVAVVGGGTAGLYALAQAARSTDKILLFEGQALGTTCARVGCMPSKAFIHMSVCQLPASSHDAGSTVQALAQVRTIRDGLVQSNISNVTHKYGDKIILDQAQFIAPMKLAAAGKEYVCQSIVLATGSTPAIPPGWRLVPEKIVTTDTFFELPEIPAKVLVVGMGPVGMELGQAMARMGMEVVMVEMTSSMAGIQNPDIQAVFQDILSRQKGLRCFSRTSASLQDIGDTVRVLLKNLETGQERVDQFGLVLLSAGRKQALAGLGLENAGITLGPSGFPVVDEQTLACEGQRIFLAGDASGLRPFFHDAASQGALAGTNAVAKGPLSRLPEKVPLNIVFTRPNVCSVGSPFSKLAPGGFVQGQADCRSCGRAIVEQNTKGRLCLYVDVKTRALLGAEMAAPEGEHLAHLLAAMVQGRFTLENMLALPFYHPTYEELLQSAARDAQARLRGIS